MVDPEHFMQLIKDLKDLIAASDFHRRVQMATPDERVAVGADSDKWLMSSAVKAAESAKLALS